MLHTVWTWILAHPMTVLAAAGVVLSVVWYAVRKGAWPGVPTEKLPRWARIIQALVELVPNAPGAVRTQTVGGSSPPGSTPPVPPVVVAAVLACLAPWVLAVPFLAGVACRPATEIALRATPGVPHPTDCAPVGATRCFGHFAQACSASGRWWDMTAAPCPWAPGPDASTLGGCIEDTDAGARCAPVPATDGGR